MDIGYYYSSGRINIISSPTSFMSHQGAFIICPLAAGGGRELDNQVVDLTLRRFASAITLSNIRCELLLNNVENSCRGERRKVEEGNQEHSPSLHLIHKASYPIAHFVDERLRHSGETETICK